MIIRFTPYRDNIDSTEPQNVSNALELSEFLFHLDNQKMFYNNTSREKKIINLLNMFVDFSNQRNTYMEHSYIIHLLEK